MKLGRLLMATHHDPELLPYILSQSAYQVACAATTAQALERARHLIPEVILVDVDLPGLGGVETARLLLQQDAEVKILLVSDRVSPEEMFAGLLAGAIGYAHRKGPPPELLRALSLVSHGLAYLEPAMNLELIQEYRRLARRSPIQSKNHGCEKLSTREQEVLIKIAEGLTNDGIAKALQISTKTVQTHRAHLMEKLGLHDRVALVKYAFATGLHLSVGLGGSYLTKIIEVRPLWA